MTSNEMSHRAVEIATDRGVKVAEMGCRANGFSVRFYGETPPTLEGVCPEFHTEACDEVDAETFDTGINAAIDTMFAPKKKAGGGK